MLDTSFRPIAPMLAYSIEKPFDSPDYLFEPKWDGIRCISYLGTSRTRLFSRNQKELTQLFPELSNLHRLISGHNAVLDGEIITLVDNTPSFPTVLMRIRSPGQAEILSQQSPAVYIVFDILMWNDENLMPLPLEERKELLSKNITESDACVITHFVPEHGIALYEAVKAKRLEGIVAKRRDSSYTPGKRSRSWLKCKIIRSVDACIVGFTPKNDSLASLALAVYQSPTLLCYIGHVGTGFSEEEAEVMRQFFGQYLCDRTELNITNVPRGIDKVTLWVYPKVVCEVNFLELTTQHKLRHPSFVRIRPDKQPEECTWKQFLE